MEILREVTGSHIDAFMIVQWRNENADAFPPQEPWNVPGQRYWYNHTYLTDPSLNLYFVEVDAKPIGLVGMRISEGSGEMMWMILGNKNYAGRGYMKRAMRKLIEAYGLEYYWGRVMPENKAGLQFQYDNGFHVISECDDGMLLIARDFDGTWPEAKEGKLNDDSAV